MKCQRCNKKLGEYFCSVCKRVVCSDCKVIENGNVFCLDCFKKTGGPATKPEVRKPKDSVLNILKNLIYTITVILIGVILIFFISNHFIGQMDVPPEVFEQFSFILNLLVSFESLGLRLMIGLIIILIILIIAYLIRRRKYKNI